MLAFDFTHFSRLTRRSVRAAVSLVACLLLFNAREGSDHQPLGPIRKAICENWAQLGGAPQLANDAYALSNHQSSGQSKVIVCAPRPMRKSIFCRPPQSRGDAGSKTRCLSPGLPDLVAAWGRVR